MSWSLHVKDLNILVPLCSHIIYSSLFREKFFRVCPDFKVHNLFSCAVRFRVTCKTAEMKKERQSVLSSPDNSTLHLQIFVNSRTEGDGVPLPRNWVGTPLYILWRARQRFKRNVAVSCQSIKYSVIFKSLKSPHGSSYFLKNINVVTGKLVILTVTCFRGAYCNVLYFFHYPICSPGLTTLITQQNLCNCDVGIVVNRSTVVTETCLVQFKTTWWGTLETEKGAIATATMARQVCSFVITTDHRLVQQQEFSCPYSVIAHRNTTIVKKMQHKFS